MILIVDDDPLNQTLMIRLLEQAGYTCQGASSGEHALRRLAVGTAELVLLDLNLPDCHGLELLAEMRAWNGLVQTPVIVVSSSSDNVDIQAAFDAGAVDYLVKPIVPALLQAKVELVLSRHEPPPAADAPTRSWPAEVERAAQSPTNLIDKYVLVDEIGQGGMGVVVRAWDTTLDIWVALKFLHDGLGDVGMQRFEREAQTLVRLDHPNICRVLDLCHARGRHFIAMDLLDGENCEDRRFAPRAAARIIECVARAVHYAHEQGVIHRDIKPANLIVDRGGKPWITDFGIATSLGDARQRLTPAGLVLGSLAYMSHEYLRSGKATVHTDIYALGATMFSLLTDQVPFGDVDTREAFKRLGDGHIDRPSRYVECPDDLEYITVRAMSDTEGMRYESCAQLADDLRDYLDGRPLKKPERQGWLRRLLSMA